MISNAAVCLIVLPILIVVFTLMDPIGALRAKRPPEPEALPVLPAAQALPTPVLLPRPVDANRLGLKPVTSMQETLVVEQTEVPVVIAEHLEDSFFDEDEDAPLVEPPDYWDYMAEYQGRMPTFDYSESDRYNIADGVMAVDESNDEFVDDERGVYQTRSSEFEPQAT
ncbi:hypothetical protein VWT76_15735 [Xanthomonas citri pv. citri]|uniref:hypothetical protein n=1 Tax=Xanthomonas TaxID=338 RepID=UPI0010549047|nr:MULTISPECIES: hypothetical protein [Xanthomonas]MBD5034948.1 hypothetical protein [Xanthomonas citri pv. citri]MBD5054768.1 hypothetical protein [Xanthomonas citri pv. citri]MCC8630226.1 hypothetical protein [Xanthomonas vesicatoria]